MHLPTLFQQPIYVTVMNDMGHLELVSKYQVDPYLYRLITDNIETTYEIVGGYGITIYRATHPKQLKEYKIHGQQYMVDFSHL